MSATVPEPAWRTFTGGLFLIAMFFAPLVSIVPFEAATPALVVVGFLMFTQVRTLDLDDFGSPFPHS